MIVDDETDVGSLCYGENCLCDFTNFFEGRILRPELDQIRAAVAKLLGDKFGRAAIQVRAIDESVESAIGEGFHRVFVNIVCQSKLECRTSVANGPLKI